MLDWLREELVEARLFRTVWGANNRTADDLANMMYLCLLSLEILRHEDRPQAVEYSKRTIWLGGYNKFSPSGTDLYNIMVMLSNQAEYENLIKTNYDVSPGLLEVTSYLRRVYAGTPSQLQDRFILINLSKLLQVHDYSNARRIVGFWENATAVDKRWAVNNIVSNMRRLSPSLDIFQLISDV
jgi:hypothetical protein